MKKIGFAVTFVIVAVLALGFQTANAQEKEAAAIEKSIVKSPLIGSWQGQWEGRRSGRLDVVFVTETSGTLMAMGTDSFGSDPKPLSNVSVDGQKVKFRAGPFDVTTNLSHDGKSLTGKGWYGGYLYDVSLKKQ